MIKPNLIIFVLLLINPFIAQAHYSSAETDDTIAITFTEANAIFNEIINTEKSIDLDTKDSLTIDTVKGSIKSKKNLNIQTGKDLSIKGNSLCSIIFAPIGINLNADQTLKSDCLLISAGDIILTSSEVVNKGSIIAGGLLIINGEEWTEQGFEDGGYYESYLSAKLLATLMQNEYGHFQEFIPRAYLSSEGKQMLSIPPSIAESIYNAFLNAVDPDGDSFLVNLAWAGNLDAIKWLLNEGADPYLENIYGLTAFDCALKANQIKIANFLADWMSEHPQAEYERE